MSFAWPQALLLAIPLGLFLWKGARMAGWPQALRAVLLGALVVALARPEFRFRAAGADVVVVVDRSRSMPAGGEARAEELIRLLASQRRDGDRLGVVSFGRDARVEMGLSHDAPFGGFTAALDAEASNLSAALDAAGELVPPERTGRVLVITDGRATGLDARAAARRLAARGLAVDSRYLGREDAALDVAITALEVPPTVTAREPFLLTATVKASLATRATLVLARQGRPLVKMERDLVPGPTVLTFRDLVEDPGLVGYELRVTVAGDGVPENDVGRAVVRVEGPPRVLLLTQKPEGTLARTLAAAHLQLEVKAPFALGMEALENVGAVVLEDVEASSLGEGGLRVLAQYVREAGGGLVMTGGRHAFGEGGYRKSALEDVLPVSLEIREEQRKAAVAISIILDCSCSMGATVPDGRTKMELAAEGVVGALQLLNERDEASVDMIDTSGHQVFGMSAVADGLPLGKVARGFSGGGGIYIGEGLRVGRKEILSSSKETRHVLLFADAADSEEPADYQRTLSELAGQNVTVSVIGMGSPKDSDAELLRDVARRGNGRIYFAEDVTSLPRIFSQETIAVARSSYVEVPCATTLGPDLAQLGKLAVPAPFGVGGYNLAYLRPRASVAFRTADDNQAPVVAFWPHGAGRAAALTLEVDGKYTGPFRGWAAQAALLEQVVRWVMPPQANPMDGVARAALAGNDLHVTLDFDPRAPPPAGTPTLVLLNGDAKVKPVELPMRWEDEERVGAHFTLPGTGTWHPVVKLGDRVFRAPPVTLPWAPEFEPAPAREGQALLAQVVKAGGGVERLAMTGLFADALASEGVVQLAPALVLFALLALLVEVVVRRFFAGPRAPRKKKVVVAKVEAPLVVTAAAPAPSAPSAPRPSAPPADKPSAPTMGDALAQARERAKKRHSR